VRTETKHPVETKGSTEQVAPRAEPSAESASEQHRRGGVPLRRPMLVLAAWPYHTVRAWIDRRRKVIDLRDRGLNAAVGLAETATRPGEPEGRAASAAAPGTDRTD
jgi:hypothetical protein